MQVLPGVRGGHRKAPGYKCGRRPPAAAAAQHTAPHVPTKVGYLLCIITPSQSEPPAQAPAATSSPYQSSQHASPAQHPLGPSGDAWQFRGLCQRVRASRRVQARMRSPGCTSARWLACFPSTARMQPHRLPCAAAHYAPRSSRRPADAQAVPRLSPPALVTAVSEPVLVPTLVATAWPAWSVAPLPINAASVLALGAVVGAAVGAVVPAAMPAAALPPMVPAPPSSAPVLLPAVAAGGTLPLPSSAPLLAPAAMLLAAPSAGM